jgi:hypothetical protein
MLAIYAPCRNCRADSSCVWPVGHTQATLAEGQLRHSAKARATCGVAFPAAATAAAINGAAAAFVAAATFLPGGWLLWLWLLAMGRARGHWLADPLTLLRQQGPWQGATKAARGRGRGPTADGAAAGRSPAGASDRDRRLTAWPWLAPGCCCYWIWRP